MITLTGSTSGAKWEPLFAQYEWLGILLSPTAWRKPQCQHYACDNDVFGAWQKGQEWGEQHLNRWLKMLDKLCDLRDKGYPAPLFCILPDTVGDWERTLEKAYLYRPLLEVRGFKAAIALQNGAERDWNEVLPLKPDAVFIGGTTKRDNLPEWKWLYAEPITRFYQHRGIWVHIGRVNGTQAHREALRLGVDSVDGTGLCKFTNVELPRILRARTSKPESLFT